MIYTLIYIIITGIIFLTGIFYRNKKKPYLKSRKLEKILAATLAVLFLLYMATAVMAYMHGADMESLQKFGILRTIRAIQNSPVTDRSVNLDQQGNILIYYRFGCRDCEAVYDELKTEVEEKENIYWVASRQSEGQKLLQKYTVSEVPTGVVIQKEGMYISHVLCNFVYDRQDGTGSVRLDTHALNRLVELQCREK